MSAVELRPLTPSDYTAVCTIHDRSHAQAGVPRVLNVEELAEGLAEDAVGSLDTATRVAVIDGQIAGYAYTVHLPSEVREERCYIMGAVDPTFRGRGAGQALMQWAVPHAEARLRSLGRALPKYIRVEAFEQEVDAHRLYAACGMAQVRWGEELLRPLTDLAALPSPTAIDGVRIVPWPDDRDEEIRDGKNDAFADHWGSTPTSPAGWAGMVRGFGGRTDLSFIAVDHHDRVIGHCLNQRYADDDAVLGRSDGWIASIGVRRDWRGRGVASAMIVHSLHAFAAARLSHASLGVDADNPTGAARLYRALGFEPIVRSITSEIALAG